MRIKLMTLAIAIAGTLSVQAQNSLSVGGDFQTFSESVQTGISSASLSSFSRKQDVVGSQYLFRTWVKGSVINKAGVKFSDGLFNFDKISQNVYIQLKDNTAFLVDKNQLKTISLSDDTTSYLFEKIPSLNNNTFYNALFKGSKYSLYSLTKTKFIPADYETNGIISSGNMYNEYKDDLTYYVVFSDGSCHEISLKKKSIKNLFESEKNKVDEFFKSNDELPVDANFLSLLVKELND